MNQKFTTEKHSEDISYFNLTLTNNQKVSTPASVIVNLPADFLPPKEEYMCSIDRFLISGYSIPYFIFKDDPITGISNYYVTLVYNSTTTVTKNLSYSSISIQSNNNFIRNGIFSYQQFALIINEALSAAFSDLQIAVNPALNAATKPYVVFNTDNQKYQIYAEKQYFDENQPNTVTMFYNSDLYYFFNNYLIQFISENSVDKKDFRIAIRDMGGNSNIKTISGKDYYVMDQEYSNTNSMIEPQLISIKSVTLGVKPELTVPSNTNSSNLVNNDFSQGSIPIDNVIADFAPNFGNDPSQWRSWLTYLPAYRREHYRSALPDSKSIDISVFWSNPLNQENKFYIEPNGSMNIKFAFTKIKK